MSELKNLALGSVDEKSALFESVADKIWVTELSLKEFGAAKLYCDTLRAEGFEVEENICGIKTAFSGKFGSGKPVIGILGEFDALSGLSQTAGAEEYAPIISGGSGHGCGHNLLGAGSLAAGSRGEKVSGAERQARHGDIFRCPGEEGGAGKAYMAREGAWYALDAARLGIRRM